jgi:glutamyl-tRNA synthetase
MMIKTRFAPSPTGYLHVGGLRTALFAYLIAKQNKGKFVLRIEDTDRERFVADGTKNILESLKWAGLEIDEGVVGMDENGKEMQRGDCGSYIQSQRLDVYKKYADELVEKGHAYFCFCASERLDEIREYQQKNKMPTGYDGFCREIDVKEAEKRVKSGEKYVVRMKMPKDGETKFNDLIRGEVVFKNNLVDDQVIIKSDGFPTYHLAVVVDDHLMKITHVIRGEEWLSSTPKHLQLYKYFGWEPPLFAHLPLLLNPDKSKLSKRQGDVAAGDYAKKGYLPEAMINFVAFLGWNPGGDKELYTLGELVKDFKIEKIHKAGAVFNLEKLDWYNQNYIKRLSDDELAEMSHPWFEKSGLNVSDKEFLAKAISLEKERVATLAELPTAVSFLIELPDYDPKLLVWKKSSAEEAKKILIELTDLLNNFSVQAWNKINLETKVGGWIKEQGYTNGSVLWPMRVALSGQQNSPGPFEIAEVLGKENTLVRIEKASEIL